MKIISFIIILTMSFNLYSSEFKHFKLSPLLIKRQKLIESNSRSKSSELRRNTIELNSILNPSRSKAISENIDENTSPLYQAVMDYLSPNYMEIGSQQTNALLGYNGSFDLGVHNFSGFQWQKPMGNFSIGVDRQVAPDLFDDDRWIVSDTFTIYIDAYTFLHNMEKAGLIDITKSQLGLFAGIEFKREYIYYHFAPSFMEGLVSNFDKLFLSFLNFNGENVFSMDPYEYLKKKDYLSGKAGLAGSIPVATGIGVQAAVLATFDRLASVEVQSIGPNDYNPGHDKIRVTYDKSHSAGVSAELGLQVEFFNLLKLSLLSFNLEYSYTDAHKMYLAFSASDINEVKEDKETLKSFKKILRMGEPNASSLNSYIVSRERRTAEDQNLKYHILIAGGVNKHHTEQVIINKDGIETMFFNNRSENMKYIQGFFATLINAITQALFNVDLLTNYKATRSKKLYMEYQGNDNMADDDKVSVRSPASVSLKIDHRYTANETSKWYNKKYKKYTLHFLDKYTTIDSSIRREVDRKNIRGPLEVAVSARIGKDGLTYFNNLSNGDRKVRFAKVCNYNLKKNKRRQQKAYRCLKSLSSKANIYFQNLAQNKDMSLWKLRNFLKTFQNEADGKSHYEELFGEGNIFYNGHLSATTKDGGAFLNYFNDGTFNGLGVIDEFARDAGMLTPVTIPIEH